MTLNTKKTASFILHDDLWLALTEAAMLAAPDDFGLGVNDVRYLQGPVISTAGWPFPKMVRGWVKKARIELLLSGEKELATLEEALGYLSAHSLGGPPVSEIARIYFWLGQELFPKYGVHDRFWEILGFTKPIEITDYQKRYLLNDLRRDIRRAVVKHAKTRGKR